MKRIYLFLSIAVAGIFVSCNRNKEIVTKIEGTVVGRPETENVFIALKGTDYRSGSYDVVKVTDGHFEDTLTTPEIMEYAIACEDAVHNGCWHDVSIFTEGATVRVTFYPENHHPAYQVEGGKVNTEYKRIHEMFCGKDATLHAEIEELYDKEDTLDEQNMYLTKEAQALIDDCDYDAFNDMPDSLKYTPEALVLNGKIDKLNDSLNIKKLEYIVLHPSIATCSYLMRYTDEEKYRSEVEKAYKVCRKKIPRSYLIDKLQFALYGEKPEVDRPFIDFTLPDLNGKDHTLSKEIKGKVALLDLWASWCGYCRHDAKSMIPVYEEFKDKGFTIVGVAREREANDMKEAVEHDGYPWLNLLELKDQHNVWMLYGLGNAGGGRFLIDSEGKIIAINPTADEVREKLEEVCNK